MSPSRAPARVRQIDGVPIPTDWPQPKPNGKVRTTAAVATARALIRPVHSRGAISFEHDTLIDADTDNDSVMFGLDGSPDTRAKSRRAPTTARKGGNRRNFRDPGAPAAVHGSARSRAQAHYRDDYPGTTPCPAAEAMVLPPVHGGHMAKSKLPAAVETARATLKSKLAGKKNQPVVFAECHDDPQPPTANTPKRGRARTQPPAHLREQMPEHSDDAYYAAQAQLRASNPATVNAAVPPSDYHRGGPRLEADELRRIADLYTEKYGPILSLDQAAQVTKLSKQTLRRFVCEGKFAASVFRGRPLRFVTQRLLEEVLG